MHNAAKQAMLVWLDVRARNYLLRVWGAVEALAGVLLERGTVSGKVAKAVFDGVTKAGR